MHPRRRLALLVAGAVLLGVVWWGPPAEACASSHIRILLAGFPPEVNENARRYFYRASEDQPSTQFVVKRASDECQQEVATASYTQVDVTTEPGDADYVKQEGTTDELRDPGHDIPPSEQTIPIPIVDDPVADDQAVESTTVVLTEVSSNAVLIDPSRAPLYILDNDGPARVVLDPGGSYSQRPGPK